MKYRTLGQGLKVSAIGIGCMPMIRDGNINYGRANDDVSTRTIHEAIDLGIVPRQHLWPRFEVVI